MKFAVVSENNTLLVREVTEELNKAHKDITLSVYAPNADVQDKAFKGILSDNLSECIKNSDVIINLIGIRQTFSSDYQQLNDKYNIDIFNAKSSMEMIRCFDILSCLDSFADALSKSKSKALILNAGEPSDIITGYLYKEHNITSYGVSRKTENVIDNLLSEAGMDKLKGKLNYKMSGLNNMLWITEMKDKKGKDVYPSVKDKFADIEMNVRRIDLLQDGARSLKFFGYYHSGGIQPEDIFCALMRIINIIVSGEKAEIYLNAINSKSIRELDSEAVVLIPFTLEGISLTREDVEMPLICVLASADYASAVSLAVKTLSMHSAEIFRRTIKLDPYLASLLTLKELSALADEIIAIERINFKELL